MKTEDFDFELDESLIAQTPLKDRSASRLMVLDKKTGEVSHDSFKNIVDYLNAGDVLVLNNTKVIPARLLGEKADTHAHIELMLLHRIQNNEWECLVRPLRRIHLKTIITFGNGLLKAKVIEILEEGIIHVEFIFKGLFYEILDELGTMPLPPYIKEKLDNPEYYQTVYAKEEGSVAAPTAGLHFTKEILEQVQAKQVQIAYITLHVGLGTFRPVKVDDVTKHKMHTERYYMTKETADILNNRQGRIVAVGTTTTRTLESIRQKYDEFKACSGSTDIFIYPGYEFKAIDALITNFHLPKSTLVMLVSAFSKKEYILQAYKIANEKRYRFFSFGDCMLIE